MMSITCGLWSPLTLTKWNNVGNNADLNIVRHSQFQPKTNCVFRTFREEESFWTKKQSCKFSKVDIMKWRLFFDFVCFDGCHILKLWYLSSGGGKYLLFWFFPTSIWQRSIPTQNLKRVSSQYFFHISG